MLDFVALQIGYFVLGLIVAGLIFVGALLCIAVPVWLENAYNAVLFFKLVDATTLGLAHKGPDGTWYKRTWARWLYSMRRRTFDYPLRSHIDLEGDYVFTIAKDHPVAAGTEVSYKIICVIPERWYALMYPAYLDF